MFTLDAATVNPQIALKALNADTGYTITTITAAGGTVVYDLKPQSTATRAQMAQILMNFNDASNK